MKSLKKPAEDTSIDPAERVTNETVSQHRDAVLSKGRKFKYPFQHSKHRVAFTSVAVVLAGLLFLALTTGYQLYKKQNTSDFTYQVTQIIPFPVAKINGDITSYESYLFELKPSLYWLEQYGTTDLKSADGKRQIEHFKEVSLERAMTNTIARSLANENNITIDEKEVDKAVSRVESLGGNLDQVVSEKYNFGVKDFRRLVEEAILRLKVAKALDKEAPVRAQKVVEKIATGVAFADVAKELSEDPETQQLGGDLGKVEKGKAKLPEEVAAAAFTLPSGQTSGVIETKNGDYYVIKVNEKLDENRVKLSLIQIKVKDMSQYLKQYEKQNKVSRYIKPSSDQ